MQKKTSRVGLARAGSRRANVYESMHHVRADLEAKVREQVLLKPNFLSSENQLASTHADAMRGAIDFLQRDIVGDVRNFLSENVRAFLSQQRGHVPLSSSIVVDFLRFS